MINLTLYSHVFRNLKLIVTTDDEERQVELNYELPDRAYINPGRTEDEVRHEYFQRFQLQQNSYIFSVKFRLAEQDCVKEKINFLMKIGSVSKCIFEELDSEPTQIDQIDEQCTIS